MKNWPVLLRVLRRPWVAVALVLHGVLLYLPLPDLVPEVPEQVRLTELPPTPVPPVPAAPSPSSAPAPSPTPTPAARSSPTPRSPQRSIAALPSPRVAIAPASPPTPTPVPSPTPTPVAAPTPSPTPQPSPTPEPVSSPNSSPEPPLIPGAIAGCLGSADCWQTPDTQWRSIAQNLQQTLRDQGYELREIPLSDDTGRRIYEVSKTGEPSRYLNLISTLQGTIYVYTETPMSTEELNQAAGF